MAKKKDLWAVTVRLKSSQKSVNGGWYVTVNGDVREVTKPFVSWTADGYLEAAKSYNPEEVEQVCLEHNPIIMDEPVKI
jgi:hypothetical protein